MKRRYNAKDIWKRHEEYISFLLSGAPIMDFQVTALGEYERGQKATRMFDRPEVGRFRLMLKKGKFYIPRIALSVTNQCSLKCQDCANLMPYCQEKYSIEVEEQIKDIKQLLTYVDGIVNIEVIGGEPFVYRELPRLLEYLCNEPKIRFIEITTNGTIIPSEEVMKSLNQKNLCVYISDYGEINEKKAKQLYQMLIENKVNCCYMYSKEWILPGGINRRRKSRYRLKYEYYHCFARKICKTMYRGKLYVCGRAPILDELGLLTDETSYLDIRKLDGTKNKGADKIKQFFNNQYAECCDYCDCHSDKSFLVKAGLQVER